MLNPVGKAISSNAPNKYVTRSNRSPIRHYSDDRPETGDLDQLLVPAQQHAHLLPGAGFTQVTGLDLREPRRARRLRGEGLARLAARGGPLSHALVAVKKIKTVS